MRRLTRPRSRSSDELERDSAGRLASMAPRERERAEC